MMDLIFLKIKTIQSFRLVWKTPDKTGHGVDKIKRKLYICTLYKLHAGLICQSISVLRCVNSQEYMRNTFYYNEPCMGSTISSDGSSPARSEMKWCIWLWNPFLRIWSQGRWGSSKYSDVLRLECCWRCCEDKIWFMFSGIVMQAFQSDEMFVGFDQWTTGLIETPLEVVQATQYVYDALMSLAALPIVTLNILARNKRLWLNFLNRMSAF